MTCSTVCLHCYLYLSLHPSFFFSFQVWFQNRRSKERRMKQLSALGARRHAFFRGPRRMRPLGSRLDEPDLLGPGGYGYYGGMRVKNLPIFHFFFHFCKHDQLSFIHRTKAYFSGTICLTLKHLKILPVLTLAFLHLCHSLISLSSSRAQ